MTADLYLANLTVIGRENPILAELAHDWDADPDAIVHGPKTQPIALKAVAS